jgi:hypothetical protein
VTAKPTLSTKQYDPLGFRLTDEELKRACAMGFWITGKCALCRLTERHQHKDAQTIRLDREAW